MSITDWPLHNRPREKLMAHGAAFLSDAELLAIFLRVGMTGKSAVELGQELINHFGSLAALFEASIDELSQIKGIGAAKFVQLQAVLEMSKRALKDTLQHEASFKTIDRLKTFIQLQFQQHTTESLVVLFFNANLTLIEIETISSGNQTAVLIPTKQIITSALRHNAHSIILAHNHPFGSPTPSEQDILSTKALQNHMHAIEVQVLDHFIIADGFDAYSMAEHQLI